MFRQAWTRLFRQNPKRTRRVVLFTTAAATGVAVSYKTRQWRHHHLEELASWQELYKSPQHKNRTTDSITTTMKRAKLMGSVRMGVSQELENIRKWHTDHGYKGGLVLRELNTPIFVHHEDDEIHHEVHDFDSLDAMALARRECYYLYYELKGNGEIRQEIFCRGTTLGVDILTCLQFWWKYDDDLQCLVHRGFANHAQHLLKDILPLLAPPSDKRATIEVSGHSLGGAVAFLLAMKLKLLGYNVVKLTTVGAPRFCNANSVKRLSKLLPPDTLRIEDDLDIVPFLPPFASHLGDKLWLVHDDSSCRYVPFPQFPWTESVWINFCFYNVLTSFSKHHRVLNYVNELLRSTNGGSVVEDGVSSLSDERNVGESESA